MRDQRSTGGALAIHRHALGVGSRRRVGEAQRVLHVQAGSVVPDHARVGPEEAFLAVRIPVGDSIYADTRGQQARDEVHQVDIMAADVGECVGVFRGTPILKIRVAIIPLLHQDGRAEPELAEQPRAILAPGHETAIVEALVILHSYHQVLGSRLLFNLHRLLVFQHQRFHCADMLVVVESGHDHVEVQLVGHRGDHDLARRHATYRVTIQFRLRVARFRQSAECLAGKSLQQRLGCG